MSDEWEGFEDTTAAKSDQVNAADLIGTTLTITITKASINSAENQPVTIWFDGSNKAYRPCKGARRVMMGLWGKPGKHWIGRSLTLFRDPDVIYSGGVVGGIRISAASHIDGSKKITVPVSRGKVKTYHIQPLTIASAPTAPDNALALCEAAARRGTDAFRAWWGSDEGKACRPVAQANIEALKSMASAADPAPDQGDDEPPM